MIILGVNTIGCITAAGIVPAMVFVRDAVLIGGMFTLITGIVTGHFALLKGSDHGGPAPAPITAEVPISPIPQPPPIPQVTPPPPPVAQVLPPPPPAPPPPALAPAGGVSIQPSASMPPPAPPPSLPAGVAIHPTATMPTG
jgi:hypothetical protein